MSLLSVALWVTLCGLSAGLSTAKAAEKIPALAKVSTKLPQDEQKAFRQKSAELEAALNNFKIASDRFNAKPAKDQSDEEFAALSTERARYIAATQKYNSELAARVKAVEFGDPKVVDARNVPSGLSKAVENAIVGAYADAPAGVSDRVRKGFQAVADRDWKVAKAWFEDAFNRDPGNPNLKRFVALVAQTPEGKKPSTSPRQDSVPAKHTFTSLNISASKMSTEQVMKALEGILAENTSKETPREIN